MAFNKEYHHHHHRYHSHSHCHYHSPYHYYWELLQSDVGGLNRLSEPDRWTGPHRGTKQIKGAANRMIDSFVASASSRAAHPASRVPHPTSHVPLGPLPTSRGRAVDSPGVHGRGARPSLGDFGSSCTLNPPGHHIS